MAKKKATLTGRAWRTLRLALLWARKGGALRRWRLMLDLRIVPKSLRSGGSGARTERIRYMERELSFDETPTFNFKMSRPASLRFPKIPCMTAPSADLDNDEGDWIYFKGERECEYFRSRTNEGSSSSNGCLDDDESESEDSEVAVEEEEEEEGEEEGIDSKAEEFIAKFYEQMKLQRQVSLIEYNEMLHRGVN